MAASSPVLELESLYVKIFADADQFNSTVGGVLQGVLSMNLGLAALGAAVASFVRTGVSYFGQLDDALTRSMAHMRDWGRSSEGVFKEAILGISSKSTSDMTDMAKALGVLGQAGFNAAGAAHALSISENLAVASGMSVTESATKQVKILTTLGLLTKDVNQDYAQMNRLGDLLVGVSHRVNTTEEQLADALGNRFGVEMRNANMSLEDGIALLGVFSLRQTEAGSANQMATRFIEQLVRAQSTHRVAWHEMGIELWDAEHKMRPMLEILTAMDRAIGSKTEEQRVPLLQLLGLGASTQQGITPQLAVLGTHEKFAELLADMKGLNGVMQEQADMIRRDFASQMKILWNNILGAATAVGSSLAPVLVVLAEQVRNLFGWFSRLNVAVQSFAVLSVFVGVASYAAWRLIVWPVVVMVGNALLWVGGLLVGPVVWGFRLVWWAAMLLWQAFVFLGAAVEFLATAVYMPINAVGMLLDAMRPLRDFLLGWIGLLQTVLFNVFRIIMNVGTALIDLVISLPMIVLNMALFLVSLVLAIPVIAAIGALIATIALSLGSLMGALLGGLAVVWDGIKSGLSRVGEGIAAMRDTAVGMWDAARASAASYFTGVVEFGTKLVGFFWHFQQNMSILWDWLRVHWKEAADDIGTFIGNALDKLALDFQEVFYFIIDAGGIAWQGFWTAGMAYAGRAFDWIRSQWSNLMDDMGEIFKAFGVALGKNFMTLMGLMGAAGGLLGDQLKVRAQAGAQLVALDAKRILAGGNYPNYNAEQADILKDRDEMLARLSAPLISDFMKKLVAPDFSGIKFKTDIGLPEHPGTWPPGERHFGHPAPNVPATGLYKVLDDANAEAAKSMSDMGVKMAQRFGLTFQKMHSLMEGFTPTAPWLELFKSFNTEIPKDAADKIAAFIRNPLGAIGGGGDDEGRVFGKEGPGFSFRQISLSRMMLGGMAATTIDYQQLVTLKAIDDKMTNLVDAARGLKVPPQMAPLKD